MKMSKSVSFKYLCLALINENFKFNSNLAIKPILIDGCCLIKLHHERGHVFFFLLELGFLFLKKELCIQN